MAGQYGEAVFDELPVFREGRALQDAVAAIAFVVEERMALPRHVDAYLVRAARFEPAFDHIGGKKGYKKNKYKYDDRTVRLVEENWKFALDQWGYSI